MLFITLHHADGSAEVATAEVLSHEAVLRRLPPSVPPITHRFPADSGCYTVTARGLEILLEAGRGGTGIFLHLRYFYCYPAGVDLQWMAVMAERPAEDALVNSESSLISG